MSMLTLLVGLLTIDPNAGTTGFDFLRIPPTAREAAMGGAAAARAESPLGFWYNPAHAPQSGTARAQVGYLNYVAGIHVGSVAYSQPIGSDRGVGLGLVYLYSGTMKRTNERGEELGTFGASFADLNLSGTLRPAERLSVGIGVQGLYGSIDSFFSVGMAGNVGATYGLPIAGLQVGLSVRNLGYQMKSFQTGRDPMPTDFGAGLAYQPNSSVNLSLDVHKPIDNRLNFSAGVEGWVADLLVLRAGYTSTGTDLKAGAGADVLAGFATGFGVRHRGYQLDYCFIPMVQLGVAHRISISFTL